MAIRRDQFTLRALTLSSVTWYGTVALGWTLLLIAVFEVITAGSLDLAGPLIMSATLLVLLELLPLVQGRGHDPQGVVMSTAFVCAMLFLWGPWPAIVMVSVAALTSDLRARKQWWKPLFNVGQYSLSVGAGYLVMLIFEHPVSLSHPLRGFDLGDMVWVPLVWTAYFIVNLALVAGAVSFSGSFRAVVADDFLHYTAMTYSVLALSPLVVVLAQTVWALLPLPVIPLLLLYYTAQMSLEREHAAAHDVLTGLPNRSTLQFTLTEAFGRYRRDERPFGLLLIDVDDFKRVNDTLGHQIGDELLIHFADRLRNSVRPSDQVARLGGDEFAVVVADADELEVRGVAERIRASMVDPFDLDGLLLEVELSVGIAVCPQHGTDGSTLLRRADVAMYIAKESRAGIEIYSLDRDENSPDRLSLLGELRQALDDNVLELAYQPKLSTRDASTLGVEALVRWQHPKRGNIPPDAFIPLAERSGIMPLLTERVISLALKQMALWRDQGMLVPIAVNISPSDLVGNRLTEVVTEGLQRYDLPATMLQLEITERMVAHQVQETSDALQGLRDMGVTISLDDFGTGYSSLVRLHSLPVDEIKIDRVFVSSLSTGDQAVGIVRALIDLAHALHLPAIAEGVETQEEWQLLDSLGCDGVQGWHVAMPMPHAEAGEWMRARNQVGWLPSRADAATDASNSRENVS
ncbi:MAG: putative bifunctional diguanylate cyclase/phosphodiesterase [Jatrophihabitantaceae bacterium]